MFSQLSRFAQLRPRALEFEKVVYEFGFQLSGKAGLGGKDVWEYRNPKGRVITICLNVSKELGKSGVTATFFIGRTGKKTCHTPEQLREYLERGRITGVYLSDEATRLLWHLNDNTWTSRDHARSLGYESSIEELTEAGLVSEQMVSGTPVIVIERKTHAVKQAN